MNDNQNWKKLFAYFSVSIIVVGILTVAYFIWPTPYDYSVPGLRIHRLTGQVWRLDLSKGWEPLQTEDQLVQTKNDKKPLTLLLGLSKLEGRMWFADNCVYWNTDACRYFLVRIYNPLSCDVEISSVKIRFKYTDGSQKEISLRPRTEFTIKSKSHSEGRFDPPPWMVEQPFDFEWEIEEAFVVDGTDCGFIDELLQPLNNMDTEEERAPKQG